MRVIFHEYGTQHRLVLNVLCGRVAEYGVEFALDASEQNGYRLGGDSFLKDLAAAVREDPKAFAIRGRFC